MLLALLILTEALSILTAALSILTGALFGGLVVDRKRIDLLTKCIRKVSKIQSTKGYYPLQWHFGAITPLIRPPVIINPTFGRMFFYTIIFDGGTINFDGGAINFDGGTVWRSCR